MSKLCIDCKHHRRVPRLLGAVHMCLASGKIDVVDGSPIGDLCEVLRDEHNWCGPEGKLFEAKPKTDRPLPNKGSAGKKDDGARYPRGHARSVACSIIHELGHHGFGEAFDKFDDDGMVEIQDAIQAIIQSEFPAESEAA